MKLENEGALFIYMLVMRRKCHARCAAHPYYSMFPKSTVNVAGEAWLAGTWARENVGIRQRAGAIIAAYMGSPIQYISEPQLERVSKPIKLLEKTKKVPKLIPNN